MAAEFKILVGADLDAAVKSINDFVKTTKNGFANVDAAVVASTNEFKKLQSELNRSKDPVAIASLQKRLQALASTLSTQIPQAADKANKAVNNIQAGSNRAGNAVLNFGRIAQDASFGFIGIANNIEPFIQSLTSLRNETPKGTSAIKTFFGALAGPAGIGVLIGAISLFDAYSNGYGVFAGRAKAAGSAQKDFNTELENAKSSATSVGVELQALAKIAGDASQSDKVRTEALKQVNLETEKYGITITQAGIASGQAAIQIDKLTNSLVQQAVAAKFADKVAELKVKEIQLTKEVADAARVEGEAKAALLNLNRSNADQALIAQQVELQGIKSSRGKASASQQLAAVQSELTSTESLYRTALIASLDVTEKTKGKTDSLAGSQKKLNDEKKESIELIKIERQELIALTSVGDRIIKDREKAEQQNRTINEVPKVLPPNISNRKSTVQATAEVKAAGDAAKTLAFDTEAAVQSINAAIASLSVDALTGFASAFGEALATGDITAGIRKFAGVLGQAITALGVQVVTVSETMVALKAALSSGIFAGPLGIVAGLGLIVAGAALSRLANSGPKLARGGVVSSPTNALIGDGGPEAVIPLSQLANIIGGAALQMSGGSGGGLSIVRGQDIYYSNNNASRSFGRLFG